MLFNIVTVISILSEYKYLSSMKVLEKTKNRSSMWSSNATRGHRSRKDENSNLKRSMHPRVHSSALYSNQDMEANCMFINRWMDKENVVHTLSPLHTNIADFQDANTHLVSVNARTCAIIVNHWVKLHIALHLLQNVGFTACELRTFRCKSWI